MGNTALAVLKMETVQVAISGMVLTSSACVTMRPPGLSTLFTIS